MKKKISVFWLLTVLSFFIFTGICFGQDPIVGKWRTIDDKTNKPKSIVQIYEKNGRFFGRIIELFMAPDENPDPVCDKCDDDDPRKDQPVKGMIILTNLEKDGDEYEDGDILDPKEGNVYSCDMAIKEDGRLKVRGYIGFSLLGRTQYWHRID